MTSGFYINHCVMGHKCLTFVGAEGELLWELRESNPRPSACKADALNQLS